MEFKFSVNDIFRQPIVKVGSNMLPPGFTGDRRAFWDVVGKVSEIVNAMGESSAAAQGLTKPITTADRLRNSEHSLYLLIDQNGDNGRGAVTGMLKVGKKGLYVFDRNGQHYQVSPPCVLDFYIHESRQRTGLGKRLFEHMLQEEKIEPVKMAIDRPSDKFLGFLNKYYSLSNPVKQMNNYVVFDGFFPSSPEKNGAVEVQNHSGGTPGKKQSANGLQTTTFASPMGRYGAPRPPCSMGQIIHNQTSTIPKNTEPTGVEGTRSVPEMSQGTANDRTPNMTQSVPNMYYQSRTPQKLDGLCQNDVHHTNYESDKRQHYDQQQSYGDNSNVSNMYHQDNVQIQQQNVTALQQNQYNTPYSQQNSQLVGSTPNSNVQNQGLNQIGAQAEMMHVPNVDYTLQQEGYNGQSQVAAQNLPYHTQATQNIQQYPIQSQYTTQSMQPVLQQQSPVGHIQNQVPQAITSSQPFVQNVPLVTSNTEVNQYQYKPQFQQPYTYVSPSSTTVPSRPQTLPTYNIPQNPPSYTMPATPYHTQAAQYTTSPTMQYPLAANQSMVTAVDSQYSNQVTATGNVMPYPITQPTTPMVEPPTNNTMVNPMQSQPTIPSTHQISPHASLSNQVGTTPQHQPPNVQFSTEHVPQPTGDVNPVASDVFYQHLPQVRPVLPQVRPVMTSQPNITAQYQPQDRTSSQAGLRDDLNPATVAYTLKQSSSQPSTESNDRCNYNHAMVSGQNVPQNQGESVHLRNPQFSLVDSRANVRNEPQHAYNAQGDTRAAEDGSVFKYGYPSQVPDALKQARTTNMISVSDR